MTGQYYTGPWDLHLGTFAQISKLFIEQSMKNICCVGCITFPKQTFENSKNNDYILFGSFRGCTSIARSKDHVFYYMIFIFIKLYFPPISQFKTLKSPLM